MNTITGICPICDAPVALTADVEVSEVVTCSDCKSPLVVKNIDRQTATLENAPQVEEDWGE